MQYLLSSVYYKELPLVTGDMYEILIVTYSPKYKAYQQKIRNRQIERALKLEEKYTCNQILETLRSMQMTLLNKESGYIPSYRRITLTDKLHDILGFRTDFEFISKSSMRNIISKTKSTALMVLLIIILVF